MGAESLTRSMKNTQVQCKLLDQKRLDLLDAIDFIQSLNKEIEADGKRSNVAGNALVITIAVSMVTDIVWDSISGTAEKLGPGQKVGVGLLQKLYDKARGSKWEGSRHKAEIEKIDKAKNLIKMRLPQDMKFLADVFGNMAANTIGMMGAMTDKEELREMHAKGGSQGKKNLKRLAETLQKINDQLANCEPEPIVPRGLP
jgi:hypothetical protein